MIMRKIRLFLLPGVMFYMLTLPANGANLLKYQNIRSYFEGKSVADSIDFYYHKYDKLLELNPDSAYLLTVGLLEKPWLEDDFAKGMTYYWKASALFRMDNYDEAIYEYIKAKDFFIKTGNDFAAGDIQNSIGLVYRSMNDHDEAEKYFNQAIDIFENHQIENGKAESMNYLGSLYLRRTKYDEALDHYQEALKIRKKVASTAEIASNQVNIALVYRNFGRFNSAFQRLDKAHELYQEINDSEGLAHVENIRGSVYFRMNDFNDALKAYQKSLKLAEKNGLTRLIISGASNIGTIYKNLNQADSSKRYLIKVLNHYRKTNNEQGIAKAYNDLGNLYKEMNDLANAMEYYISALRIRQKSGDSFEHAATLKNIGSIYTDITRYDKALDYYLDAAEIEQALNDRVRLAYTYNLIGNNYRFQENFQKAIEHYQKSLNISESIGNKKNMAMTLNNIGEVYYEQGEFDNALKHFEKALSHAREVNDQWRIATELNNLGNIYRDKEDYSTALNLYQEALELNQKVKNRVGEALVSRKIGEIHLERDQFNAAIPHIERSLNMGMQLKNNIIIKKALYALYEYYRNTEDYEKAMLYLYDYYSVQDSLLKEMNNRQVFDVQLNYEIAKREEMIQEIREENELLTMEKKLQEAVISRDRTMKNFLAFTLFAIVVIAALIYNRNRMKQKANKALNDHIKIIEETNQALTKSEQELRALNATKDKFFNIIAHDLKNPIGGLITAVSAIRDPNESYDEKVRRQYHEIIMESAKQVRNLLENLLQWSRSQTGSIRVNKDMVFLKSIIDENIDLLKLNTNEKKQKIHNRVHEEISAWIDRDMISTVVRNLISNAIKFTPEEGKITISSKESKEYIYLNITDTGVGIPENEIKNIFRIDQHYTTHGTNNESGSGLGLIICKEFVEKNNGTLEVESAEGSGTSFIVKLPKHRN
jgi:signal transduction histidine kinase/predicted negative regulator of RcsB-dependent stress response